MTTTRRKLLAGMAGSCLGGGCATLAPDVDSVPWPHDPTHGLLVGRAEFLRNGVPLEGPGVAERLPHLVVTYVRPFTSTADLARASRWAVFAVAARARLAEQGFFALKLPSGRYCVDQFAYTALGPTGAAYRPHGSLPGQTTHARAAVVFDIAAGGASYTGSVVHQAFDVPGKGYDFRLRIVDETAAARAWIDRRLPAWSPFFDARMAQTIPL